MQNFFYVYILTSDDDPECNYTGFTEDLEQRLKAHNAGQVPHTKNINHGTSKPL
jgi:predicted GIY-YIG superfamily endonuclease